jgi:transcriptional regulator with XRE-family HTH domain
MAELNAAKVIRRVRQKLEVSQEGLSRLLNATKGAVQHWERGRNNPDLARLLALRQLCPSCAERKELDALIKQTQARVAPFPGEKGQALGKGLGIGPRGGHVPPSFPSASYTLLRRDNHRLQRQVAKLEATLQRRSEQLRILEDLATDLQREMAKLRAAQAPSPEAAAKPAASSAD